MRPSPRSLLNILVPVKRAVDYSVKIRVNPAQTGIDTNVKHSMNPFDEIAVEEAVRLRERFPTSVTSIKALTIGGPKSLDTLRTALAVGADEAIHVTLPSDTTPAPEPLAVAKTLAKVIKDDSKIDMVILGKQAIDDDLGVTGQMLAGLLGWSQATFASKVELLDGEKEVQVTREIDGGSEVVRCKLPVVVTTDLRCVLPPTSCSPVQHFSFFFHRLNEPRYASLPNIMKAKKKPVKKLTPEELGVDYTPQVSTLKVSEPPKRTGGGKVASVEELVAKLKEAGIKAV